ncbi:MAG TPA: hypothetical protein VM889_14280 [Candidatus Thermoplasmatota archaeon]|jgi:hypothetical protein|nr:hypothetical protein [Candidatus Thermoplasmatota archaeon]
MLGCLGFAFAAAYPHRVLTTRRRWFVAWSFTPALAFLIAVVAWPGLMVRESGFATPSAMEVTFLVTGVSYAFMLAVFLPRWVRQPDGPMRAQFSFVLLALAFWALHDGLSGVHALASHEIDRPIALANAVVHAAGVFLALAVVGHSARRVLSRAHAPEDRAMLVAFGLTAPFAALQFLDLPYPMMRVHLAVDVLVLPILAYGAVRYQILDVDIAVKRGIKRGTLGAVALAILLVVQQMIEQYVGSEQGVVVGGLVAGLAIFAATPLQRAAERLSERAMPNVSATESYLNFRRLELYRVALEGILADGVVETTEVRVLKGLREELGVSMEEHNLLERQLREKAARAVAA